MKNKVLILIVVFLAIFSSFQRVSAQDSSAGTDGNDQSLFSQNQQAKLVTVATVEMYDPAIVSQEGNNFKIAFDIFNKDGVQPDVKYGIKLIRKEEKNQYLADYKIYDESLNLGALESQHREITYAAPKYLKGNYTIYIESRNPYGLIFSMVPVKEVTLEGDGKYVNLNEKTCYLTVDGDESSGKFSISEGVDITGAENLTLHCEVENNLGKDISAMPGFDTFYRSIFGKKVDHIDREAMQLKAGQKTSLAFLLPKASEPQSYDAVLSLKDGSGNIISNPIASHYVLKGASATIQTVSLDKKSYLAGEAAKLSFFWTGAADNFEDSRFGSTDIGTLSVKVEMTSDGKSCINSFQKNLKKDDGNFFQELDINIKEDCSSPQVAVSFTDSQNKVLAKRDFKIENEKLASGKLDVMDILKTGIIILAVVALIFALLYVIRKKKGGLSGNSMIFLMVFLSAGIFFAQGADAATVVLNVPNIVPGDNRTVTFTVELLGGHINSSTGRRTYYPGQLMGALGIATNSDCANSYAKINLEIFGEYILGGETGTFLEGGSATAQASGKQATNTPGDYTAVFTARILKVWFDSNHDRIKQHNPYCCCQSPADQTAMKCHNDAVYYPNGPSNSCLQSQGAIIPADCVNTTTGLQRPTALIPAEVRDASVSGTGSLPYTVTECWPNTWNPDTCHRCDINGYWSSAWDFGNKNKDGDVATVSAWCRCDTAVAGTFTNPSCCSTPGQVNGCQLCNNYVWEATGSASGVCGTANGVTFPNVATGFAPYTQCATGNASSTAFPPAGGSSTWTCSGLCGGAPSPVCTAWRANASDPAAPVVSLSASPNPVSSNTSSTLTWSVTGAVSCTATNSWSGPKSASGGTESTGNLTFPKTYTLECWSPTNVTSGPVSVTVGVSCTPNYSPTGRCIVDSASCDGKPCGSTVCNKATCYVDDLNGCGPAIIDPSKCANCASENVNCPACTTPGAGGSTVGPWKEVAP